jgi:hypothetical protein
METDNNNQDITTSLSSINNIVNNLKIKVERHFNYTGIFNCSTILKEYKIN